MDPRRLTPIPSTDRPRGWARSLRTRWVPTLAAVATVTVGLGISPASGFGSAVPCSARSESAAFSRWSDTNSYFLAPNGGFENGATDWQLSGGAGVVAGNESYKVRSSSDAYSLKVPYGATAESRTICVARGEDSIRLFVKNGAVPGSILHVEAIVVNPATGMTAQTAFDVNGDAVAAGWSPTMRLTIPNLLGSSGTQNLTLRFTTRGTSATWYLDDVYVDPFKSI